MTDIADIGFRVDTGGLDKAAKSLDNMGDAAGRASKAGKRVEGAFKGSGDWARQAAGAMGAFASSTKDAAKQQSDLMRIMDRANPAQAALRKFREEAQTLNRALREGVISQGQYKVAMRNVGDEAKRASTQVGSLSQTMGALRFAFVGIAGAIASSKFLGLAGQVDDIKAQLELLTGSAGEAERIFKRLADVADAAKTPLQDVADSFIGVARDMVQMGYSADEAADYTQALSAALDASAIKGQRAESVMYALSKAMGMGKLSGMELNTVLASGELVAEVIAQQLGVSTLRLRELGAQGKITGDVIAKALIGNLDQLQKKADTGALTTADAMRRLGNAVTIAAGEINEATGAGDALAGVIDGIAKTIRNMDWSALIDGAKVASIAVAAVFAPQIVAGAVQLGSATLTAAKNMALLALANPFTAIVVGVTAAVAALTVFRDKIKLGIDDTTTLGDVGRAALGHVANFFSDVASFIGSVFGVAQDESADALLDITKNTEKAADAQMSLWGRALRGVAERWDALAWVLAGAGYGIRNVFKAVVDDVKSRFASLADVIKAAISMDWGGVRSAMQAKSKGIDIGSAFADGLTEAAGKISSTGMVAALDGLFAEAQQIGRDRVKGLEAELKRASKTTQDTVTDTVNAVTSSTKKATDELGKFIDGVLKKQSEATRRSTDALVQGNNALRIQIDSIGKTKAELVAMEQARNSGTVAILKEKLAMEQAHDPHAAIVDLIREQIEALEERNALLGEKLMAEDAQAAKEAAAEVEKSWKDTVERMGDQFTDALIQGGASVKDALKRMFQNLVLRPIIAPVMAGLAGSLMPGSAMAGQGGGLGGLSSFLTGGGLTDSATAFISNLGSKIGGDIGAKLMMNSQFLGSIAGAAGNAFIGYGLSKGLSGGYSAGSWVNTAAGIASAIPGIGPIAGLVGAAVNRLFGRKFKDAGIYGEFTGDGFSGGSYEYYKGGLFRSNKTNETAFDDAVSRELAKDWRSIVGGIRDFADALSLEADRIDGFTHDFKISMGKPGKDEAEQAFADAWAEALRTGSNELAQQLIGTLEQTTEEVTRWARDWSVSEWGEYAQVTETVEAMTYVASEFARDGEEAIDTLTRLGTSIIATNQVFDALGLSMYEASLAGGDMASQLIDLFGGVEGFVASTASYYDKFFTEQEKFAHTLGQVQGVFAELNQELPLSQAAFRDLVEGLDLTTESGREAFAALMGVSDAFAALVPDLSAVAGDLSNILADGLLGTFDGDDVGAALADALTGGIEDAIAGHFVGQITNILVSGIVEPMVAAATTGASVSSAVSSASIDQVVSHARAVMAAMNVVLDELRGSGVLDEISTSVSSLFPRATTSVRTYASAVSSSSKAADSAAKEAERLAQAWRRLSDVLMDEVARIRGAIADTAANSLDYWQAQFAITTAQARAGDQDAAGNLTGLSRALLTAAEAQAGSLLELQQLRAQVAQSLQDTAGYASAFGGGQSVTTQSGSLLAPGGTKTSPTTITIPPSPAATQRVIVQPDPQLAAEVKLLREVVQTQGDAMRDMQHELVRYARRWDADGLPVVVEYETA